MTDVDKPERAPLPHALTGGLGHAQQFATGDLGIAQQLGAPNRHAPGLHQPLVPSRSTLPRSWDVQDIWRGLLTTALLLFFADIVVRRVMIDYRGAVVKAAALVARVLPGRRKRDTAEDVELANLLRRKQELRDKQRERAAAWELTAGSAGDAGDADDAPKLDAAFDASAAPSSESAADKPKPKKAKKPEPEPAEEGGYTSRLLAAKRRALDKRRGDDR